MHNADPAREQWRAWVNPLAQRQLARGHGSSTEPRQETVLAVVALFDISGFTALAEDLAKSGPIGAERLKERLDACFGTITALVYEHGGVVLTYPGDGALALWIVDDNSRGLSEAAAQAAACCLRAISQMGQNPPGTVPLQLRAGLAAGAMDAFCVGGVGNRWECLIAGRPVHDAGDAVGIARAGEVIATASAWSLLDGHVEAAPAGDGSHRLIRFLDKNRETPPPDTTTERDVRELDVAALRPYIPDAVRAHLDAGQADWLAAFRPATVMFIGLEPEGQGRGWALEALHGVVCCVQSVVQHYGGSFNQALVDDKGTVMVVGWGLAMHVHEDDAARAVEAALDLSVALTALGCRSSIGLSTGRIFAGIRGSRERKEYAMIGDVVNLAARLVREGANGITCDDRTRASARPRIVFEKLPPVRLKGKAEPTSVYRPVRKRSAVPGEAIVGRDHELRTLLAQLRSLELQGSSDVVLVEGEPGIGKSRLTAALLHHAQASSVRSITARGNPVERASSYHVWRPVFSRLLHLDGGSAAEARARVTSLLGSSPEGPAKAGHYGEHAPLLNALLPLGFAETETVRRMTPQGGAETLRDLLVRLFAALTRGIPTLLVMEDAHWFDSASWALADALTRGGQSLLVVVTARPMLTDEMTAECRRFFDRSGLSRLALDTLARHDAAALASHCVGADMLPPEVSDLIWRRASGHPFFTEQLALALRDSGVIRIDEGECSLVADSSTLDALALPETVQGVVTSRIDRLTPSQQIALKIASVIGPVFSRQTVQDLFPNGIAANALEADLDPMVTLRLLIADPVGPGASDG